MRSYTYKILIKSCHFEYKHALTNHWIRRRALMTDWNPNTLKTENHYSRGKSPQDIWTDLEFLKKTNLFSLLSDEERKELYHLAIKKYFIADEVIYEEGSPGDSVYILLTGTLKISVGGIHIDQFDEPGTAFGETVLQKHPRSATLTALKNCCFIIFPLSTLWSFIHRRPSAGIKILTQLAQESGKKLKRSTKRFVDRARKTPLSRYHEESTLLNIPITGSLLFFDLKKSEILLRDHQSTLDASEVLNRVIFPFRVMLSAYDGIEVSHHGDGVGIFFPLETISTLKILNEILPKFFQTKKGLEKFFKQENISPPDWEMNFRLSLGFGQLTPSFECLNKMENPTWKECENRLFTESARFSEIEKIDLNPDRNKTLVLVSSTFIQKIKEENPSIDTELFSHSSEIKGKHGVSWQFSVLEERP